MALQALAQEQAVFEREMAKDRPLFMLHLAMSWTTFLSLPASVIAAFVQPAAVPGLMPLVGLAAWNWRRVLRRGAGALNPATKHPRDRV